MKKVVFYFALSIVLIFMVSCRTLRELPSYTCENRIPSLSPEMDWMSFQSVYPNSFSNTNTYVGDYSISSTSANYSNPMFRLMRDYFVSETRNNICKTGDYVGKIVWSINRDVSNELNIYKIMWIPIFWPAPLFGFPMKRCESSFSATATIYDRYNNLVASYRGDYYDREWAAMWWGYSYSNADWLAFQTAMDGAVNSIKKQISRDAVAIQKKLIGGAPVSENTTGNKVEQGEQLKGNGSGVFVANGIIVTNYHVVENAEKIKVQIKNGTMVSTVDASVLALDKVNDLALLSVKNMVGYDSVPFAIYNRTRDVGTSIFAMGYPHASFMGEEVKLTDGIISSKTGYEGDIVTYQISAPIQAGNSGGPLFDKEGYLVGITNAGIPGAQNVGYAIKASYLNNLIDSAPIKISVPQNTRIGELDFVSQVKELEKYVVLIKIY